MTNKAREGGKKTARLNRRLSIEDMGITARARGGKCLSQEYYGSQVKLRWKCAEGHEWDAKPTNIRNGKWCPVCALERTRVTNRKYSIEDMREAAAKRGGRCLSEHYVSYNDKLFWLCEYGHQWKTTPSKILHGQWCPYCAHRGVYRVTIEEMRDFARARGGICLSESCSGSSKNLLWQCSEGHRWKAAPNSIKRGSWCSRCADVALSKRKLLPKETLAGTAARFGGECLSSEYQGSLARYSWRCAEGHEWEATHHNVSRGTWCPYCAGKRQTIEDLERIAAERGGRCLSREYNGMRQKHRWECMVGHQWDATAYAVKIGSWCPSCSGGVSERMVRSFLEQMTGERFPAAWPEWLLNDEGQRLELDGYCENLRLAFEHQGHQHTRFSDIFHADKDAFRKQQKHDEIKRALCSEREVALIEVPQLIYSLPIEDLYEFLAEQLTAVSFIPLVSVDSIRLDLKSIYEPEYLKRFKTAMEEKGGSLITGSFGSRNGRVRIRCAKGHVWEPTIAGVIKGGGCPTCAGNKKLTLHNCQEAAASKGGECLSEEYRNSSTQMRWRCDQGHEWEATFGGIRSGKWCPMCAPRLASATKRKNLRPDAKRRYYTLDDMQAHARRLGGKCLSNVYRRIHAPLTWQCSEGHIWQNSWGNIQRGQWCPICRRKKQA